MAASLDELSASDLLTVAERGVPEACELVGWRYTHGSGDFPRNPELARRWLLRSAELGGASQQAMIAELLLVGDEPFEQDEAAAVDWFRRAADGGDYSAMFELAIRLDDQIPAIAVYLDIAAAPDRAFMCWEPALELLGLEEEERLAYMQWYHREGCRIDQPTRRALIERRVIGRGDKPRGLFGWRAPWE